MEDFGWPNGMQVAEGASLWGIDQLETATSPGFAIKSNPSHSCAFTAAGHSIGAIDLVVDHTFIKTPHHRQHELHHGKHQRASPDVANPNSESASVVPHPTAMVQHSMNNVAFSSSPSDLLLRNQNSLSLKPGDSVVAGPAMAPLMADFQSGSIEDNVVISSDPSLETLDCFLSATTNNKNSNTNTSVEDDGISDIIFATDSGTFWSNLASSNSASTTAVSSVNSERKDGTHYRREAEAASHVPADNKVKARQTTLLGFGDQILETSFSDREGGFKLIPEHPSRPNKRPRSQKQVLPTASKNISFQQPASSGSYSSSADQEPDPEAIAQMKEMIYRAAAFRPVNLGFEVVEKPRRKNVRISSDPQTVAARQRRERIGERIRVLQRLVPGGSKMDTASMLDEAASYLKFLQAQVKALEDFGKKIESYGGAANNANSLVHCNSLPFGQSFSMQSHHSFGLQNHYLDFDRGQ